jgi:NAD(P)-dependent dehydrogenase (short-subunit alcohol dehydrogenase family)
MTGRQFPDGCALIIGGSGGIGGVVAQEFAKAGAHVAITYRRRKEKADQVAAAIKELGGHVDQSSRRTRLTRHTRPADRGCPVRARSHPHGRVRRCNAHAAG